MKTIAIASGKGGVGKSTIAALLALSYADLNMRVALLDVDLYGPSIPTLFHLESMRHEVTETQKIVPIKKENIQLVSFGFILGQLPAIMRGPMIARYTEQLFNDVLWDAYDVLIIDMPPGTGDIHLTITQSHQIDVALLVTTPHALSFSDVGKAMLMLNKVQVPIAGFVLNMAYFECGVCHTRHHVFGKNAAQTVVDRFGVPEISTLSLNVHRYSQRMSADIVNAETKALAQKVWDAAHAQHAASVRVQNSPTEIRIHHSNGVQYAIHPYHLRRGCRCAICYDEYNGIARSTLQVPKDVHAQQIKQVGNYALYIKWSDGHATGFFPFVYVKELSEAYPSNNAGLNDAAKNNIQQKTTPSADTTSNQHE